MHKHNILLQDDMAATGEDTAQAGRGVHWGFIVMGIGLGIMVFLMAVLYFVYMLVG
jgi:hypothetical protein